METAILLLERGINTLIKNNNNLTALDLAKTKEMKEIIGYAPHSHCRYQGPLLKKRKFLGFKEYFVVLNKGYLIYYSNEYVLVFLLFLSDVDIDIWKHNKINIFLRNDALNDQNRKGTYFLNNAYINVKLVFRKKSYLKIVEFDSIWFFEGLSEYEATKLFSLFVDDQLHGRQTTHTLFVVVL